MKIRKVFLGACMLVFFGVVAKTEQPPDNGLRVILTQEKGDKNRPKAPSKVKVECMYSEDYLSFTFPAEITSYNITVYNEVEEWWGLATKEEPIVWVSLGGGSYTVECTANDGRVFSGTIVF